MRAGSWRMMQMATFGQSSPVHERCGTSIPPLPFFSAFPPPPALSLPLPCSCVAKHLSILYPHPDVLLLLLCK